MFSLFFNETATAEIYTLSLHDALPISVHRLGARAALRVPPGPDDRDPGDGLQGRIGRQPRVPQDRKSTRLNSSHSQISYAVFCLKKKQLIKPVPPYRRNTETH